MINPWRAAAVAALCELGLVAWCATSGSAPIDTASPPTFSRLALLTADVGPARPPQPSTRTSAGTGSITVGVDIAKAAQDLVTGSTAPAIADDPKSVAEEQKPVTEEQKPVVVAALTEPSEELQETPAAPVIMPDTPAYPLPPDNVFKDPAMDPASSAILDECPDVNLCIDRFLWALYQRTPKEDSVKEEERHEVTVKRKGKMVTVTRTVSHIVDEDFAWKDSKASERIQMPMMDYVIGGMDRAFKLKLFYMLQAAQQAGLQPGITSAFRDDYRQSIASGLKAASDRSYHGGSSHGGYGHGLAADVVSIKGATRAERQVASENFWRWIDTHPEFGIGRPYRDRDPPHVGAIDGEEYVKHRGTATVRAASGAKDRKGAKTASSS